MSTSMTPGGEPLDAAVRVRDGDGIEWERTRTNWATVRPDGKLPPLPWRRLVAERGPITYRLDQH